MNRHISPKDNWLTGESIASIFWLADKDRDGLGERSAARLLSAKSVRLTVGAVLEPVSRRVSSRADTSMSAWTAIEMSAEDAQYYIRDGWTKLAEWTRLALRL